jgi:hypothetical protein
MKKPAQHLIAEVPCRQARVEMTIGIDLGDVWSITALSTKTAKWSTEAVSELHRRRSRTGLQMFRGDGGGNPFDLDQRAAAGRWP